MAIIDQIRAKTSNIFEAEPFDQHTIDFIHRSVSTSPFTFGHYGGAATGLFFGRMIYDDLPPEESNNPSGWQEDFNLRNIPHGVAYLVDWVTNHGPFIIHPNAKFLDLSRILLNGQTPNQVPTKHIDSTPDITKWSFVYYVSPGDESNGGTVFYDSKTNHELVYRANYKQGKFVIFPSTYTHQALPCTEEWRVSLGIILKLHAPQNTTIIQ